MEPTAAGSANKPVDSKAGSATVAPNNEPPKPNPFNIPDDEIKQQIFKAHDNTYGPFVADSLFIIVQNILNRSTQIVDDLVIKGYGKVPPARIDEFKNAPNINIPMCILKDIRLELSCCKDPQPETAHETTLRILSNLKAYSWEASAVLTLAAFASEFGDFWHLVELEKLNMLDPLSTSLAILKGAPNLTKTPEILTARKEEVVALNNLIKETLELMDTIFQLEKLSPVFPKEIAVIPKEVNIYWIMLSVITCGTKISILTSAEVKPLDLSHYAEKIKSILDTRKGKLKDLKQRKAEGEFFSDLVKISKMPLKVPEFLGKLFFGEDYADHVQNIIDASNNYKKVGVDVLAGKSKTLFILISYLDIADYDRKILQQIQSMKIANDPKLQEQYGIVWMPIVDENHLESYQKPAKDIESLVKNKKMEGYIVDRPVSHQAALKFLKKEWSFKGSPIVVIKDEEEKIYVNCNSFYTISLLGLQAFPFDQQKLKEFIDEMKWIVPLFKDSSEANTRFQGWVNKEKECYIFIFGGKADNWAKDMDEKTKTILKELNPDNSKTGPTIKLLNVEQTLNSPSAKDRFWKGVEGLFITKINEADHESKHQIQRLYSYKREDQGWFALNKGDKTIVMGNRDTFLTMMQDFAKWSVNLRERDFAAVFRDQHEITLEVIKGTLKCSCIEIPKDAPKLKEGIKCPECGLDMGMSVTYNCCHKSNIIRIN